ncbi:hypothetical protein RRG08_031868 [Elysia crispata]|uniref:Uncharacterized protein n=1 Tax=Elysia crispata TaxID=231223 RepID=A0AAE1DYP6_9GAST|nr:hypothetical protein RRG08_031868 [Elysia crispata]
MVIINQSLRKKEENCDELLGAVQDRGHTGSYLPRRLVEEKKNWHALLGAVQDGGHTGSYISRLTGKRKRTGMRYWAPCARWRSHRVTHTPYSRGKGRELACVIGRCTRWRSHRAIHIQDSRGKGRELACVIGRRARDGGHTGPYISQTHGEKEGNWYAQQAS